MELWPRRSACDGDVTGHEEEEHAEQFSSEVKQQKRVSWVHKEQVELLSAML